MADAHGEQFAVPDWSGAKAPRRVVLEGRHVRLEPLADVHHDDLIDAALGDGGDPALWNYLPYGPFGADEMRAWLESLDGSPDPMFFAIAERARERASGMLALLNIVPAQGTIELGHVWFGGRIQRSPVATEAVYLTARHVFDDLGYRRYEWKCDAANARSRAAAERFGFVFEGTFRQHLVVKGRNRDTAWFSITDREWPAVRAAFDAWLEDGNFDSEGRQLRSLRELRA